ncbi:mitochondrial genome maintenance MGM101-domain-containing protein [Schizothecium vesticola]|uniref:Mitochondrial genome maintenance protein MGM101 n=1 Tax=Schizothecium vesticola TaxID=314040 RepID=A0AA40F446_9PEZI|nr:mitochondrial genome maintenance MGM101-domain-containing protein [Schizothecium vesticola]
MRSHALRALRPFRSILPTPTTTTRAVSTWKPRQRVPVHNTGTKPPPPHEDGIFDPQPAIPAAAVVTDLDPSLSSPPTISTSSRSAGFTAALSGSEVSLSSSQATDETIDWSSSFHGLSTISFPPETAAVLMRPLDPLDVEVKPDGIIYLPEIKYRRILNQAFGPGGWGLAPRGETVVGDKVVTREYALIVHGRFIAQARGECQYFSEETIPTAGEGCKSNALLRCCKDLGIASELWDPRFIRDFKKKYAREVWVEHVVNKKKRQVWTLKDTDPAYPYQLVKK